jgi:hypothetical protein
MKSLGSLAFSLLIVSMSAAMIADPSPDEKPSAPPSGSPIDRAKLPKILFEGYSTDAVAKSLSKVSVADPDAAARILSKLSPAVAAEVARQGYTFSIKNQAEMTESLRKAGFTSAKAKPAARGIKFVTGKTWVKGGLVAVSVYETYMQVAEILDRPNAGAIPSSHDNITPAFRWRLGAAVLATIAFAVYCFLRWNRILR